MQQILDYLKDKKYVLFEELLSQENTRKGMIILFLALLELIRLGQVLARQKEFFGEIRIYPVFKEEIV